MGNVFLSGRMWCYCWLFVLRILVICASIFVADTTCNINYWVRSHTNAWPTVWNFIEASHIGHSNEVMAAEFHEEIWVMHLSNTVYLFIYSLFKQAVSSSGCIWWNDRMIAGRWTGENLEGSSYDLNWGTSPVFPWSNWGRLWETSVVKVSQLRLKPEYKSEHYHITKFVWWVMQVQYV
jgi:hypothetical protein